MRGRQTLRPKKTSNQLGADSDQDGTQGCLFQDPRFKMTSSPLGGEDFEKQNGKSSYLQLGFCGFNYLRSTIV